MINLKTEEDPQFKAIKQTTTTKKNQKILRENQLNKAYVNGIPPFKKRGNLGTNLPLKVSFLT